MSNDYRSDPDDFFADTRMSFGDHIEDLRKHLFAAIKGFIVALIFSFFVGKAVLGFIAKPVEEQLVEFYERRQAKIKAEAGKNPRYAEANTQTEWIEIFMLRSQLKAIAEGKDIKFEKPTKGKDDDKVSIWISYKKAVEAVEAIEPAQRLYFMRPTLKTLSVQEAFFVWLKVCIVTGLIVGSPWIIWQIWLFVAAGLYPQEKHMVYKFIPLSLFLFLGGVAMCEFLVIPKAVGALLWFNEWLGMEPDLRLSEWLGFAILLPLVFGIAFQTPIVVFFLERLGIFTVEGMRGKRKIVCFIIAVTAAIITPSDPYSMVFLWGPMYLLFEVGIWMAARSPRPTFDDDDSDELIEV